MLYPDRKVIVNALIYGILHDVLVLTIISYLGAFLEVTDAVKGPFYPIPSIPKSLSADAFAITPHPYNPYTIPYPTMSTAQYESLIQNLNEIANQKLQKESELSASLKKKSKVASVEVVQTMEVKVNKVRTISLWASTAGVGRNTGHANNVDVAASDVEIDPLKGIEVTDPYAL